MPSQINLRRADDISAETAPPALRPRRERQPAARVPFVRTPGGWYPHVKEAADFVLALILTVLALPVIGLLALAVKLTSRGPAFYTQTRVGRNGRLFTIYKVRTMVHRCESLTGPRWSVPGDPRITAVGHALRVTHLDELPQLLNVLRGEMSLIGPRPERPEFVPELEAALPCYRDRLAVLPGVTGLAQVQLPADTDLDSVRKKLAYDLYYIRNLNPALDLRILLCTALYAVGVPFRLSRRLFAVPDSDTVARTVTVPVVENAAARFRKSA